MVAITLTGTRTAGRAALRSTTCVTGREEAGHLGDRLVPMFHNPLFVLPQDDPDDPRNPPGTADRQAARPLELLG